MPSPSMRGPCVRVEAGTKKQNTTRRRGNLCVHTFISYIYIHIFFKKMVGAEVSIALARLSA